jgi:hypothetical protein
MYVCLQLQRSHSHRTDGRINRRPPVSESALANKWHTERRAMAIPFQALHIALYGPSFRLETRHRTLNLGLIRDAMRTVLDSEDYEEFVRDLQQETNHSDGIDGMRCVDLHSLTYKP